MLWLKNTGGKKDAAFTMMIVAFVFCLGMSVLGMIENINFAGFDITFRAFDMGFAATVLIPTMTLYFGRRFVDLNKGLYDTQALYSKNEHKDKEV